MCKVVIVFAAALLAFSRASVLQPRSLVDEAVEQLEQLKSIVRGDIFVAHDELDEHVDSLKTHAYQVSNGIEITIGKHHYYAIKYTLNTLIDLATSAGHDVSSCTGDRVDYLDTLPDICRQKISTCMKAIDAQADKTAQDAKYLVDIIWNKIHNLENQLNRCKEDITCISPILTQIELDKIRMPQNIKTEVLAAETLLTTLTSSVQSCADSHVTDYTEESYAILREIENCINAIME